MSDDKTAGSASKTEEQKKAQMAAGSDPAAAAKAPAPKLEHGEPDARQQQEQKQAEQTAQDPWGETPLQMRDSHSPEVDPQKVGSVATGLGVPTGNISANSMEPGAEGDSDAPQGGTNAPA